MEVIVGLLMKVVMENVVRMDDELAWNTTLVRIDASKKRMNE